MVLIADQVNSEEKTEEHFLTVSQHEDALRREWTRGIPAGSCDW
jgi:hypothetical protein